MSHHQRGRSPGDSETPSGSPARRAHASSQRAQASLVVDEHLPARTTPGPQTVDGAQLQLHHRSQRHPSAAGTTSSREKGSRSSSSPRQASSLGVEGDDHGHPATPSPRRSDALSPAAACPARRGRGRPRKLPETHTPPKRRRGRPPNVRPDTPIDPSPSSNGGAAGSSLAAPAPAPDALHPPNATDPPPSTSTSLATPRRGPGRPRNQPIMSTTPIRICPTTGDKVDNLLDSGIGAQHDFSLTISARNSGNVEAQVFADVDKCLQERMVRGLVSMERGNVHGNLHVQGILTVALVKHFDDPRKEEAAMRKSIRQACDWNSNVKVKIVIKRLMRQQTFSGMLGYCSKDQGRPHFKTSSKGVSQTGINVALAEYRRLQRACVTKDRVELGKKRFLGSTASIQARTRTRHLRLTPPDDDVDHPRPASRAVVSVDLPNSAFAMEAARADAYSIALFCPSLFIRKHAFLLFFSGGQGGRISTSHEDWDMQDREFADMTVGQAKVCSHDRLELEGAMDAARERAVRDVANARRSLPGVANFDVGPDSDSSAESDVDARARPQPPSRCVWAGLGRTSNDFSEANEALPAIVSKCVQPGCTKAGNIGMVSCDLCDGDLHRGCGVTGGDDHDHDYDSFQGRRCTPCANPRRAKKKARS